MFTPFRESRTASATPRARTNRRTTRVLALAAAGAVLAGTAACGTSGPSNSRSSNANANANAAALAKGGGKITVWTRQDAALNPVQKAQADAFNKAQSAATAPMRTSTTRRTPPAEQSRPDGPRPSSSSEILALLTDVWVTERDGNEGTPFSDLVFWTVEGSKRSVRRTACETRAYGVPCSG